MRNRGTVKYFHEKGYGFIHRPGERDIFFHMKDVLGSVPASGDTVEYTIGATAKGPVALEVTLIKRSE